MKKTFLILAGLMLPVIASAQEAIVPEFVPGVYALKISPNGKWVGSMAGDASIFNIATGENVYYTGAFLGLGNPVANNGIAVGDVADSPVVMKDGEITFPETLTGTKYKIGGINGITPDATRVVGWLGNPDKSDLLYIPYVADMDAQGNIGEPTILPYPKLDFFGSTPQSVTAVWVSADGKTVCGEVVDWRGMYTYPIYFKQDTNGVWNYEVPSKPLFNTENLELTKNPWLDEPPYPEPEYYMSGTRKDRYMELYQKWLESEGTTTMPNPREYMTDEEYARYVKAVQDQNQWFKDNDEAIEDYKFLYNRILRTSVNFSDNDITIQPGGEFIVARGYMDDGSDDYPSKIYKFSCSNNSYTTINTPDNNCIPTQVLPNGTMIVSKGMEYDPSSWLILPGSDKLITVQEYFSEYPSIVDWIDEVAPFGTGVLSVSDDMTIFTGGLVPSLLANFDPDNGEYYYSSYLIQLDSTGVESISDEGLQSTYKVYNLQGVKVIETKEASELQKLPQGIYVIGGKKVIIK